MNELGAVRLIEAVVRNTFQAIEHPKIIGKKTKKAQIKWYNELIKWAENNTLLDFWADVTGGDSDRVKRLMIKLAQEKIGINRPS